MFGVVDCLYYNNMGKDNELNKRISSRNIPSANLQPHLSFRPVSTKYDILPIFDRKEKPTVSIKQEPIYNTKTVFNPGTSKPPWSGFSNNINTESILRNQIFALQKCEQINYVPGQDSDLYNVSVIGHNVEQPFPRLFQETNLAEFNPNKYNVGQDFLHNNTRVQYKNINLNSYNSQELETDIVN